MFIFSGFRPATFGLIFKGPFLNVIARLINMELMSSSKTILVYSELKMGNDVRKPVFEGLGTTKARTSLRIYAV